MCVLSTERKSNILISRLDCVCVCVAIEVNTSDSAEKSANTHTHIKHPAKCATNEQAGVKIPTVIF